GGEWGDRRQGRTGLEVLYCWRRRIRRLGLESANSPRRAGGGEFAASHFRYANPSEETSAVRFVSAFEMYDMRTWKKRAPFNCVRLDFQVASLFKNVGPTSVL